MHISHLEDLCELIIDCPHSTPTWIDAGILVLRSQNIRNGRLNLESQSFTDEQTYEERSRRAKILGGDIIMTREAPMGEVCMIPDGGLRCCLGQRMVLLRPDRTKCDGRFLLYALQSPVVQHQISWSEGTGSTVSNLRVPAIRRLRIPTPPLARQREIGGILGSLDDKIEQNRRTAQTLERLAQAIFRAWFVDYEPVRTKELGASNFQLMPQEIFDRLPDRFTESEIGAVPHGWTLTTNGELFDLAYGKPLKADQRSVGSVPVFGSNGVIGWHNEALVNGPGIVVGRKGNPGAVQRSDRPYFPIDTALYVVRKRACPLSWLFYTLQEQNLGRLTADSAVPGLNRNAAYSVPVALPSDDILGAFDNLVLPLWDLEGTLQNESSALASLRDILLPRLLSGGMRLAPRVPEDEGMY